MRSGVAGFVVMYLGLAAPSSAAALEVGVDYERGAVIVTFAEAHMPSQSEIASSPASIGSTLVDSLFATIGGQVLLKLTPDYNSSAACDRTFLLLYSDTADPPDVATAFSEFTQFESVTPNGLLRFEPLGTVRVLPGSGTPRFADQWYLENSDTGDASDVDAPEAWAIEEGDQNVVVGIFDGGTLVDTTGTAWRLHSDFTQFYLDDEDRGDKGVLNRVDLDGCDDGPNGVCGVGGDGVVDNVIGTNISPGCLTCLDEYGAVAFWYGVPHDWKLESNGTCETPYSWQVQSSDAHGVMVGSIAVGKLDGEKPRRPNTPNNTFSDIVGVAHNCSVYNVRVFCVIGSAEAAIALRAMAQVCRVINMSVGSRNSGNFTSDFWTAVGDVTDPSKDYDCVIVAASGNGSYLNADKGVDYPAAYPSVISVGGISRTGSSGPERVFYSRYDKNTRNVDCVAPIEMGPDSTRGIRVDSHSECTSSTCAPDEITTYSGSGTSFAAPQVTGVVALIRSRFPSLNSAQVKNRLLRSCEYYWAEADSFMYGYGKVNAYRALTEWGDLPASATWAATDTRDGKYYISGDLTIPAGRTLTIGPGMVVKVAPDHEKTGADQDRVQIVVEGSLVINGTPEEPVVFESFTDSAPTDGDWIGIKVASGGSASLSNVVIKNATRAIENDAAITLTNCTVTDCGVAIEAHAAITASGCVIAGNTDSNSAINTDAGTTAFTKCTVVDNTGSALAAAGASTPAFDKCVVAFNGGPAVRSESGWSGSATVSNSVLYGNATASGSQTDAGWVSAGQAVWNEDPAFCDEENGAYSLYAFSPAARGPHFSERVGALPVECVPAATVTATSLVRGCPAGDQDTLVVTVDLDESVMTRDIGASEIRLDITGLAAKVMDDDSLVTAVSPAVSPDYTTTIRHTEFGYYCIDDPVAVLLNGYPLAATAEVNIRTMDCTATFGQITAGDAAKFAAHYPSPPGDYEPSVDINADGYVTVSDFTFLGAHYGHVSSHGLANLVYQVASSSATVLLQFTEEYPTATTHRLYVDVDVDEFANVRTAVFSLLPGNARVSFVEWQPANSSIGKILCAQVERDALLQMFFVVGVSESFTGTNAHLGRLVFDVSGNDPIEIGTNEFELTVGDLLIESSGGTSVAAQMAGMGKIDRVLNPMVERIYHNRLEQNYPNPFNPVTSIAFSLESASHVTLSIYDVTGRRVRTLVDEQRTRGAYQVQWDGRNENGSSVSTGVYFYKLVAGSFTSTRKMALIK